MKRRRSASQNARLAAEARRRLDAMRRNQDNDDFGIRPGVAAALGLGAEPDAYDLHDVEACTEEKCAMCWYRKGLMREG